METPMEPPADTLARLAHELHDQADLGATTLDKLVDSAAAVIGCDSAGVLVSSKGTQFDAIIASNPVAEKADRLQVEWHQGPALAAVADARTTLVCDATRDTRWPRWAAGMRDLNLGSALAVRLWTSQSTLGALTFYASAPRWFDSDALAVAEILGRHASIALATARREESLWQAIDARELVGQAQGILMERFDLGDARAFEVLRRFSQNTNTKLNEVARTLVCSRTLPDHSVLTLRGEFDLATSRVLREELRSALDTCSGHLLLVDLTAVGFLDCTALGVLVGAYNDAPRHGVRLVLVGAPRPVKKLLSITQVDRLITTHPSLEAALSVPASAARRPPVRAKEG
jgi:anti-anti-sigma factor